MLALFDSPDIIEICGLFKICCVVGPILHGVGDEFDSWLHAVGFGFTFIGGQKTNTLSIPFVQTQTVVRLTFLSYLTYLLLVCNPFAMTLKRGCGWKARAQ